MTERQEVTSKYYSGCRAGCPGKVKFRSFLFRLTGTLAHPGQREGGGDIWAISKSICIFGDICRDISIPGVESGARWEQERLAAPPSPMSASVPSDRIRNSSSNRFVLRLNICWTELKRTSEWALLVTTVTGGGSDDDLTAPTSQSVARLCWDCHEHK